MVYHLPMVNDIRENLVAIRAKISAAAERAGRRETDVTIMAVTKTLGRGRVLEAYDAGIRLFGENRVQEAQDKFTDMPPNLVLHLIGHLQRNKAKTAASLFSCVQSVDSFRTAAALAKRLEETDEKIDILFEINVSGEETKSGYLSYADLLREIDLVIGLGRLVPRGLMTIGPFTSEVAPIRAAFRSLRESFEDLKRRFPELPLDTLSMGMSSDFETAVEEGATLVRIGGALFGPRMS